MWSLILIQILAVESAPTLGVAIKQGGFAIKPPAGFRMTRMELFNGTKVGAIATASDSPRSLAAALVDSDSEEAASMLVGVVEAPFAIGPGARDELSAASVHHFSNELGLKLAVERAEQLGGASPHVRVLGSVRQAGQLRKLLIAAFPGEVRHLVVTFAVPSGRFESLREVFDESLSSVRSESPSIAAERTVAWAALALIGSLLAASVGLWRRRAITRR